jgi:hypothetical protein
VGGRWDETGRAQMAVLLEAGLKPGHHLLDIGAGSLRLGCKAVDYLDPGHYWATDASREIMLTGRAVELADPSRLPLDHLILDRDFTFPGVPQVITHAIAFAVFPHLRIARLRAALTNLRAFPLLEKLLFTVFLAPDLTLAAQPFRQRDGVVTHDQKAPYHLLAEDIEQIALDSGWTAHRSGTLLPRGQVLFTATPAN